MKPDHCQVFGRREIEVARILCLVSSSIVLRGFSVGILSPECGSIKQGREGPKSGVSDGQKPMAAATQHGPAWRRHSKRIRGDRSSRSPFGIANLYIILRDAEGRGLPASRIPITSKRYSEICL